MYVSISIYIDIYNSICMYTKRIHTYVIIRCIPIFVVIDTILGRSCHAAPRLHGLLKHVTQDVKEALVFCWKTRWFHRKHAM